ncbi:MAG: hypothetical protein HQL56_11585 [Magnetococcales bacterium]|nr:hypothetical protein [Magnetococcales bacterium]
MMSETFETDRYNAAKEFVHTMIFIDDEASYESSKQDIVAKTEIKGGPGRAARILAKQENNDELWNNGSHGLNVEALTKSSLKLGLVCSVLRPGSEEDFVRNVVEAAERVDIVSLDWQLKNDNGTTAISILKGIADRDARINGRLRLISIYTGEAKKRREIFEAIVSSFSSESQKVRGIHFREHENDIVSRDGLRIICLIKTHGGTVEGDAASFQVSEEKLPEKLLKEFSDLPNGGLLSNVALATVASIRRVAHHAVSRFHRDMDGPFLHHRAIITRPEDSEEYGISVIMGDLKNTVLLDKTIYKFIDEGAVRRRIENIRPDNQSLILESGNISFSKEQSVRLFVEGLKEFLGSGNKPANLPSKEVMRNKLSSILFENERSSENALYQFAFITSVTEYPENIFYKIDEDLLPGLCLGSIVWNSHNKEYLLCTQAICDCVWQGNSTSQSKPFSFIRLSQKSNVSKPDFIVQFKGEYIKLFIDSDISYTEFRAFYFRHETTGKSVVARRHDNGYIFDAFLDKDLSVAASLQWVANMKERRASRAVQNVTHKMGRIGFDEFEPFRK